jgi:ABC-type phosphate/phosphonate transport system substrate-binding protein
MNYVNHFCKNSKCNNNWLDVDVTNAKTIPPKWKYCKECCKSLGIEFDSQTYKSKLSDERKSKLRNNLLNYRKQTHQKT